jgi:hypothetical protein
MAPVNQTTVGDVLLGHDGFQKMLDALSQQGHAHDQLAANNDGSPSLSDAVLLTISPTSSVPGLATVTSITEKLTHTITTTIKASSGGGNPSDVTIAADQKSGYHLGPWILGFFIGLAFSLLFVGVCLHCCGAAEHNAGSSSTPRSGEEAQAAEGGQELQEMSSSPVPPPISATGGISEHAAGAAPKSGSIGGDPSESTSDVGTATDRNEQGSTSKVVLDQDEDWKSVSSEESAVVVGKRGTNRDQYAYQAV